MCDLNCEKCVKDGCELNFVGIGMVKKGRIVDEDDFEFNDKKVIWMCVKLEELWEVVYRDMGSVRWINVKGEG